MVDRWQMSWHMAQKCEALETGAALHKLLLDVGHCAEKTLLNAEWYYLALVRI